MTIIGARNFVSRYGLLTVIMTVFAVGVFLGSVIGTVFISEHSIANSLLLLEQNNARPVMAFITSMSVGSLLFFLLFLFTAKRWGIIPVFGLVLVRGIMAGLSQISIYSVAGIRSVFILFGATFLQTLLLSACFILAANIAIINIGFSKGGIDKKTLLLMLALYLSVPLSAVIDCLIIMLLFR